MPQGMDMSTIFGGGQDTSASSMRPVGGSKKDGRVAVENTAPGQNRGVAKITPAAK